MARIVVIDDEAPIRQLLADALVMRNHEVGVFADGRTALSAISTLPPDLIICDVNMPGLNGYELLAAVRSQPATAAVPVLLITGRATYESMRQGMVGGADDYLPKPFTADELFSTVDHRLGLQAARRQSLPPLPAKLPAELQAPLDEIAAVARQLEAGGVKADALAACGRRLRQAADELRRVLSVRRGE
jgi:DNA-binding response OmpR family regulator